MTLAPYRFCSSTTFTRVIYVHYQGSFDRHLAAGLALVLVFMTLLHSRSGALESEDAPQYSNHVHGKADCGRRAAPDLGRWQLPLPLALCTVRGASSRWRMPALTVGYWLLPQCGSHIAQTLARCQVLGVEYALGFRRHRHRGRVILAVPVAYSDSKVPEPPYIKPLRVRDIPRIWPAGHCHSALARLLWRQRRATNLSDLLHIDCRLSHTLPAAGIRQYPYLARASTASLEEASRSLGRSWHVTLRTVTLPLVRGGATAGGIMVFVTTLKELPITLLLGPIGFKTLATEVWSLTAEGFFADAATVILVLLGISLLPTLLFAGKEP